MNEAPRSDTSTIVPNIRITDEISSTAIESLESYFQLGGVSILQAAFAHTYFVHPDKVREKTPYFPDRARLSRKYYPGLEKGSEAMWHGNGQRVRLDDNSHAQNAWQRYTGHELARGSGYGVRHIWGHPWDPDFFTAGWNLCYMPFWAGMLTESQHPFPALVQAVKQASWDLYFRNNPVCPLPASITDPGLDLHATLDGRPLLILERNDGSKYSTGQYKVNCRTDSKQSAFEQVKAIRMQTHQSWINICKASRSLQGKTYGAFGTRNVENGAKSCVRRIHRETGLSFHQIEILLADYGFGYE